MSIGLFNVQAYESASKQQVGQFVAKKMDVDILCVQEDRLSAGHFPGYTRVSVCRAESAPWLSPKEYLANSIYVKAALASEVRDRGALSLPGEPARCATAIKLADGLILANVHLSGGRYDDPEFSSLLTIRADQLRAVITKFSPDIIVGDFNGEPSKASAKAILANYPLYGALSASDKNLFLEYYLSGHQYLKSQGYRLVTARTGTTSAFGGKPDHVYVRTSIRAVGAPKVVNAIKAGVSDHNAITLKLRI